MRVGRTSELFSPMLADFTWKSKHARLILPEIPLGTSNRRDSFKNSPPHRLAYSLAKLLKAIPNGQSWS